MGFWVFDFFFVGFGCDCGLWLKWRFGGSVGGGHMKVVAVGCGCHMKVVTGGVCGCDNCV